MVGCLILITSDSLNNVLHPKPQLNQNLEMKILQFACFTTKSYVMGTQKNHLIEMVLLSTHSICFLWKHKRNENKYFLFSVALVLDL